MWRFLGETVAVFAKDMRCEFRTRVAFNSLALFAVTTLAAVSYTIGPYGIAEADRPYLLGALLWIVVFFAAMAGLDRAFVKEEETHTAPLLRLAARPLVVWGGKLLFNMVTLALLMAILVPLYVVLMGLSVRSPGWFVLVLASGCWALAVTTTIVAAIVARAMSRGALFAVLSMPLLLPLLVFLIQGTRAAIEGGTADVLSAVRAVVSLGGVMTTVSVFLFPVVWHDSA